MNVHPTRSARVDLHGACSACSSTGVNGSDKRRTGRIVQKTECDQRAIRCRTKPCHTVAATGGRYTIILLYGRCDRVWGVDRIRCSQRAQVDLSVHVCLVSVSTIKSTCSGCTSQAYTTNAKCSCSVDIYPASRARIDLD